MWCQAQNESGNFEAIIIVAAYYTIIFVKFYTNHAIQLCKLTLSELDFNEIGTSLY